LRKTFAGKEKRLTFAIPKSSLSSSGASAKADSEFICLGVPIVFGTLSPKKLLQWQKKSQDL
jgi:hypothetical protein